MDLLTPPFSIFR